ncbi:hypothetical protein ACFSR7_16130 [Cohnella sp. GCM10020058]|uniref:hypothetical protein n=1 Tax=Cohnella sp. GCM10020058 TaxID=3317330 RepID=UPI0036305495
MSLYPPVDHLFSVYNFIIFPEFFEWVGCILLKQDRIENLPSRFSQNQFISDRTALEAEYNHIHMNDLLPENLNPFQVLAFSKKLIEVWAAILHRKFSPTKRFILVLSFDEEEVVIRFYTFRESESQWVNISSLESYMDGLMVIEV